MSIKLSANLMNRKPLNQVVEEHMKYKESKKKIRKEKQEESISVIIKEDEVKTKKPKKEKINAVFES